MIIKTHDVHKHFGGNIAVDSVSLEVKAGQITSVIGPNGSGKSTLFNMISGFIPCDNGKIEFNGSDITKLSDYQTARAGISRSFQEVRVFSYLTIREHFDIVCDKNNEKLITSIFKNFSNRDELYHEQLKRVGLEIDLDIPGHSLSYGQGKLVNLAMCLVKAHGIVLLDEPVAGVNPLLRKQIEKTLLKLREESETILLIEHDMNFVTGISDWIIVMDSGKIITQGTVDEILNNQEVLRAYLGR